LKGDIKIGKEDVYVSGKIMAYIAAGLVEYEGTAVHLNLHPLLVLGLSAQELASYSGSSARSRSGR
jgi:hypothetical protein